MKKWLEDAIYVVLFFMFVYSVLYTIINYREIFTIYWQTLLSYLFSLAAAVLYFIFGLLFLGVGIKNLYLGRGKDILLGYIFVFVGGFLFSLFVIIVSIELLRLLESIRPPILISNTTKIP